MSRFSNPVELLRRVTQARYGLVVLFWISVLEGAVLPVPMETVLAPYMQLRRDLLWWIAAVALAGFVTIALAGYAVGALFFDALGQPILEAMRWQQAYGEAQQYLQDHGFWALVVIIATPIPAQLGMIGAGALGYPVLPFILAMIVARGSRYFGMGVLVLLFGDRAVRLFERWRGRASDQPTPPR